MLHFSVFFLNDQYDDSSSTQEAECGMFWSLYCKKRHECNLVPNCVCCIGALYPVFNLLNIIKHSSSVFSREK
jgi:hypothetical protein